MNRFIYRLLVSLCILLGSSTLSAQNDVFVSDVSGTDAITCGSSSSPCKTIQYAVDSIAVDGDTVRIDTGEYSIASSISSYTPVVQLPEGKSLNFIGSTLGQGTRINGDQTRRGFLYYYIGTGCNTGSNNDGVSDTLIFTFRNLIVEDCKITETCGTTTYAYGGGMRLDCDSASEMHVWIDDCIFRNNQAYDVPGTFAGGRSASGGAIFILGRRASYAGSSNYAQAHINNCDFQENFANQNWNGGHGGAILLRDLDTASVTNSSFCDNYVYSQNADNGDLGRDRNAGGAICFYDLWNSTPAHGYRVSNCSFLNNHATTNGGAGFANQSEGGAIFLTKGDVPSAQTTATVWIDNSGFYGNYIETGIEHIDNNSGTLDTSAIGFNAFYSQFGVALGPDTLICEDDSVQFDVEMPGGIYLWSTGSTSSSIWVHDSGEYSVTVTVGACEIVDTVYVGIQPFPTPDLGSDTSLCPYDSVSYDVSTSGGSYLWSTGSTLSSEFVYGNDSVWVEVTVNGCSGSDTLVTDTVEISGKLSPDDTLLCPFETYLLDASVPGANYVWTDNSFGPTFLVTEAGEYRVTVTKHGCTISDTIVVDYVDNITDIIGEDSATCQGDTIVLEVTETNLVNIIWNDGGSGDVRYATTSGEYWVEINDQGCLFSDTVNLQFDPVPLVDLGPDSATCEGDTITIDAFSPNCTYLWQDNAPYATRDVTESGLYSVTVSFFGCTASDEVYLTFHEFPVVDLPDSARICENERLLLNPSNFSGAFTWQDGSTAPTYEASLPGTYAVTVSNNGCAASDQMELYQDSIPTFDLGLNDTICEPNTLQLNTNRPLIDHVWQDSTIGSTYDVSQTGRYWVTAQDGACSYSDTIFLRVIPLPAVNLGNDTTICFGDTFSYRLPKDSVRYLWSNGKHQDIYLVDGEDQIWVQATNTCGSVWDSVLVETVECDCRVFIPNSFSPGSNGLNDLFKLEHTCDIYEFEFQLFDRWGEMVFSSSDPAFTWDGSYKGKPVPQGVYAYRYRYKAYERLPRMRLTKEGVGHLNVLR